MNPICFSATALCMLLRALNCVADTDVESMGNEATTTDASGSNGFFYNGTDFIQGHPSSPGEFWRENRVMLLVVILSSVCLLGLSIGLTIVDRRKTRRNQQVADDNDDNWVGNTITVASPELA